MYDQPLVIVENENILPRSTCPASFYCWSYSCKTKLSMPVCLLRSLKQFIIFKNCYNGHIT